MKNSQVVVHNIGSPEVPEWICYYTTSQEQIDEAVKSGGYILNDIQKHRLFGKYENRVSPENTIVSDDGQTISFTPPSEQEINEEYISYAKINRSRLLRETDFYFTADYPLSDELKEKLITYRQALRDITKQSGWPTNIIWPEKPV